MSNRRKPTRANLYRAEFLTSPAWLARRARWFRKELRMRGILRCRACGRAAPKEHLALHHVEYSGVRFVAGAWRAFERHDDLVPLHPVCHDMLHRLIDRDEVLAFHRDRRTASAVALERLRQKFQAEVRAS